MKKRVIEVVKLLRGNPYIGKPLKGPLLGKYSVRIGKI